MISGKAISSGGIRPETNEYLTTSATSVGGLDGQRLARGSAANNTEWRQPARIVCSMMIENVPDAAYMYRFVREELTNEHRRAARRTRPCVEAFVEDHEATVIDCGERSHCCRSKALRGLGLLGIRDRLQALGGGLTIAANEPTGERVIAYKNSLRF